jgi:deoxyhypusine synthase
VYTVETAINEFLCLNKKNYKLNEMQRLSYNIMILNTAYKHEESFIKSILKTIYGN